jgi:hypothetical protein
VSSAPPTRGDVDGASVPSPQRIFVGGGEAMNTSTNLCFKIYSFVPNTVGRSVETVSDARYVNFVSKYSAAGDAHPEPWKYILPAPVSQSSSVMRLSLNAAARSLRQRISCGRWSGV